MTNNEKINSSGRRTAAQKHYASRLQVTCRPLEKSGLRKEMVVPCFHDVHKTGDTRGLLVSGSVLRFAENYHL